MSFQRARGIASRLIVLDSAGSTNAELVALAVDTDLADFTTLITDNQTDGRGRLGRAWMAPTGTSLAISVLVRTDVSAGGVALGWLPLAAGVAMTDAVAALLPRRPVGFKWPNDVQVEGRKVCGILSEIVPGGASVVIGAGLNVTMTSVQLPVPTATSLMVEGAADDGNLVDDALAGYLSGLRDTVAALWAAGGDAERSGLRAAVIERCTTIGREVRVELPGGAELLGRATGIDAVGRLEVRDSTGQVRAVAAGDIIHLR